MQLLIFIIATVIIMSAAIVCIRYEPSLDLVYSGNKKILFLWYNSFNWMNEFTGRKYIKLFEV